MALENTTAKYTIEVLQTGTGATEAVQQFQAVDAAAKKVNATINANTSAVTAVAATTKTATASLKAMQGTLTLIGAQTFPQLTLAAITAQSAFTGLRTASAAMGVSMLAVAGPLAVIAAGLYKIVEAGSEAVAMFKAMSLEKQSGADLSAGLAANAEGMRAAIMKKIAAGQVNLSANDADVLDKLLSDPTNENLKAVRRLVQSQMPAGEFMTPSERNSAAAERIGNLERSTAHSDAAVAFNNPDFFGQNNAEQKQFRINDAQQKYNDQVKLYNQLRAESIYTETELRDMTIAADTARMNSITQIRSHLTEMQQLGRQTAELFAGGFSQAFVSIVSGTKRAGEAFREFAVQMLQQTAQMVTQMAIMRVLFGAAGASTGTGGLIGGLINKAATGGMFPQMMAAGGMAGVSSVSNATYFPRFNVVAGEAGREMMTVLARPRMMEVGGMQAMVGSAQGNQLAITSASDLAGRGAGGVLDIRVTLGPELRAEIVNQSVQGARVTVAQDMRSDTPISRGVKGLTG